MCIGRFDPSWNKVLQGRCSEIITENQELGFHTAFPQSWSAICITPLSCGPVLCIPENKHSCSSPLQTSLSLKASSTSLDNRKGPSVQFSSVSHSCLTLDPMNRSTPGLLVHHQLLEFTQTHVHRVGDAIQPSHALPSPSPPAPNPSQHQGLFQWVNSLHEVAKVLEFQLQHQSFQWTPRTDLL